MRGGVGGGGGTQSSGSMPSRHFKQQNTNSKLGNKTEKLPYVNVNVSLRKVALNSISPSAFAAWLAQSVCALTTMPPPGAGSTFL